jgi:hypothetical protein
MIYSNRVDNFYLTPEQLANSPSRADGVDEATERELRHYCCDVVAEAVVLLRLPQVVAATAQVFVQRFYCKRSVKKFDVEVRVAHSTAGLRRFLSLATFPGSNQHFFLRISCYLSAAVRGHRRLLAGLQA